jgi:inosose dehydratase
MALKLGNAPSSWGVWFAQDPLQTPWQRFMDEVADAGFRWIELGPYGYLPTDAETLKQELEQRNLRMSAGFVTGNLSSTDGLKFVLEQVNRVGGLLASVGASYLIVFHETYLDLITGQPKEDAYLGKNGWARMLDVIHLIADHVQERFDLGLLYEPHTATYVETPVEIEQLLLGTDSSRVGLCFDIGHFALRGHDPVAFYRKHAERIPYVHIKNVNEYVQARVLAENLAFPKAVSAGIWSEPSEGTIDFNAMRAALTENDFDGWAIVEQGMYPAPFDKPLPIAKRTYRYLRDTGWV